MLNNKRSFEEGDIIQLRYFDMADEVWREGIAQVLGVVGYGNDLALTSYQLFVISGNIEISIGYDYLHDFIQDNAWGHSYAHYVGNINLDPAVKLLYGKKT